jgi:Icc-related predicted phosphoesterase
VSQQPWPDGRLRDARAFRDIQVSMARFTIYFATDVHGSERCFRKFLNAGKFYGADAVILGGDVAGKALVPIVANPDGSFAAHLYGKPAVAKSESELGDLEARIRGFGFYPYRASPGEVEEFTRDPASLEAAFEQVIGNTLERWLSMAEDRLRAAGLPCLVMPGNDDPPSVKKLLDQAGWLRQAEERVVEFGPYQVVSLGYSTPTPWDSPREITEDEMAAKLAAMTSQLSPGQPVIFNLHNPPFGTATDRAYRLTPEMRIETAGGEPVQEPVGSRAVREAIENVQPVLALCGHIHESRGTTSLGRTLVVNPGSAYPEGVLQGSVITLDKGKVKTHRFVSG